MKADEPMKTARKLMGESIREIVIPELRRRGFKGSVPHYRRVSDKRIDLLTFQFNKYGGSFVVEIGSCPSEGITIGGMHIPPSKINVTYLGRRLRLGSVAKGDDHWFKFGSDVTETPRVVTKSNCDIVARKIISYLDIQAENFWNEYNIT